MRLHWRLHSTCPGAARHGRVPGVRRHWSGTDGTARRAAREVRCPHSQRAMIVVMMIWLAVSNQRCNVILGAPAVYGLSWTTPVYWESSFTIMAKTKQFLRYISSKRSRTDKFAQKFSLCADLVKALVWTAIILPCCLCLFDFLLMCYHCLVNKVEYIIRN